MAERVQAGCALVRTDSTYHNASYDAVIEACFPKAEFNLRQWTLPVSTRSPPVAETVWKPPTPGSYVGEWVVGKWDSRGSRVAGDAPLCVQTDGKYVPAVTTLRYSSVLSVSKCFYRLAVASVDPALSAALLALRDCRMCVEFNLGTVSVQTNRESKARGDGPGVVIVTPFLRYLGTSGVALCFREVD